MKDRAEATVLPQAGDSLAGKYRLTRLIGQGGMGAIFEATNVRLGQRVAIKVMLPIALGSTELVARFEREARAAARLSSRHVVRVLDVAETQDGIPFIVMEYLEGHDLATELERRGALPIAEAVDYLLQVCDALEEAHAAGIVHRDLKPPNVFLAVERGRRIVKVVDFGISKVMPAAQCAEPSITKTSAVMGTPMYMSPEQLRSAKHVDARADIWALGAILYECVAGRPPFGGDGAGLFEAILNRDPSPLCKVRPDAPVELGAAAAKALQKRPADRHQDIAAFVAAILPFWVLPVFGALDDVSPTEFALRDTEPRPAQSARQTGDDRRAALPPAPRAPVELRGRPSPGIRGGLRWKSLPRVRETLQHVIGRVRLHGAAGPRRVTWFAWTVVALVGAALAYAIALAAARGRVVSSSAEATSTAEMPPPEASRPPPPRDTATEPSSDATIAPVDSPRKLFGRLPGSADIAASQPSSNASAKAVLPDGAPPKPTEETKR